MSFFARVLGRRPSLTGRILTEQPLRSAVWVVACRQREDGSFEHATEAPSGNTAIAEADGSFAIELITAAGHYRVVAYEALEEWSELPREAVHAPLFLESGQRKAIDLPLRPAARVVTVDYPLALSIVAPLRALASLDTGAGTLSIEIFVRGRPARLSFSAREPAAEPADTRIEGAEDIVRFEELVGGLRAEGLLFGRSGDERSAFWHVQRAEGLATLVQCRTFDGSDPRAATRLFDTLEWRSPVAELD